MPPVGLRRISVRVELDLDVADLRLYRLAFIPAVVALVVLAFSLRGVPSPVEPPPGTLEFDAASAAKSTRDVLALGGSREPGSDEDNAVADLVAERFGSVVTGTLGEQTVEATIDGEETELRNVLLTLPGESDHAIVVIAGRDSREGEGAPSSAAATGVLLELVNQLSVAGRNRTLILASTSGASAEGQGARELIEGLPDRTTVDAVVVISQPGFDEPFEPHLVMSGGLNGPPLGLARTAEEILRDRANLSPGKISTPAQIARYAIPAASGEQAGLIEDGLDAVAISSAGELPLPASENGQERLDTETLARIGPALLALVSALDAAPSAPAGGPGNFLWTGNNLLPGWSVGLVVLALLLPPLAVSASILARAETRRRAHRARVQLGARVVAPRAGHLPRRLRARRLGRHPIERRAVRPRTVRARGERGDRAGPGGRARGLALVDPPSAPDPVPARAVWRGRRGRACRRRRVPRGVACQPVHGAALGAARAPGRRPRDQGPPAGRSRAAGACRGGAAACGRRSSTSLLSSTGARQRRFSSRL